MKKFLSSVISLLLLLFLSSCGGSGDCWAKRQALTAEIDSVAAMDLQTFQSVYGKTIKSLYKVRV
ncbi:MAG: hypothetical protein MKZ69_01705, partial [Acidimicrobiales bacterium]|nr:hypothetical protein [Acidimicrobiales bacterium]